jgi:predicted Ser/Thr protein kinase
VVNQQPTETSSARPRIGRYRLLARIGEGGMGVVHLAQGPDGSRVALKVLRQHVVGDDEARARLAREVASLRRVSSPRVAEVLDADPWGETPFVATRYVPGLSLHEHVRQEGPITGHDLAFLSTALMEAVVAVHRVGVLHRDIKPANVLLEGRAPVLIDFGLARLAEDPRLTQTGWLLGTPGYLAPEILYGDEATTASDVHSWAATVVFAATGRPPFGTGPAMAIMDRVRRGEHDLSAVPRALLPVVRACLAPEPADRPTTDEVLRALRSSAPGRRPRAPAAVPPLPPAQETVPYALGGGAGVASGATRVLGPPPTRVAPVSAPVPGPVTGPVGAPTRAPYQAPPPPALQPPPPSSPGLARVQRGLLLGGLFATVTVGFAKAPYLSLLALSLLTLGVRTASWTSESARERRVLRGRRRWYDVPLTFLSVPWYCLVAVAGTLVLLVWSGVVAFVVGFAYLLFGAPLRPGLLVMGAVLATTLWWGPGSRRVRVPTRRLLRGLTRRPAGGWLVVAVVAAVAVLCCYALVAGGIVWEPSSGPPWRSGTILGDVLRWV